MNQRNETRPARSVTCGRSPQRLPLLWMLIVLSLAFACSDDDKGDEQKSDIDGAMEPADDAVADDAVANDRDEGRGSDPEANTNDDDGDDMGSAAPTDDEDDADGDGADDEQPKAGMNADAMSADMDGPTEVDEDTNADGGVDDDTPAEETDAEGEGDVPTVEIAAGTVKGKQAGETYAFLGIPYAEPPVGELRFAPPAPVKAWEDTRDATDFGKRCAQLESTVLQNAESEDEDCLYLNVWTRDLAPEAKKPVMVWIHGGGNVNGSASEPLPFVGSGVFYSGQPLAESQDLVVVTFNYRLGVFGFLHDNSLGLHGNQGLWDQQAVLAWVRENIERFGGDPSRVTIFGESAGSQDVCLHMASPASRGLFQRAISQSGGCTTIMTTAKGAAGTAQALQTALQCDTADEPLACLRSKSVAELLAAANSSLPGRFGPTVDRDFLPAQPRTLFDEGEIADVPYILGSNSDEGTLFVGDVDFSAEGAYEDALQALFGPATDEVMALYPLSDFVDEKPSPAAAAYARVMGDSRLVCTTFDSAVRAARAGRSVYMYNFDVPVDSPGLAELNLGATHGAELVYVFGTSTMFTPAGKQVSDAMQAYWGRFAANGDVAVEDAAAWPPFSAQQPDRLNFASGEIAVVEDFRAELCEFWQERYALSFAAAAATPVAAGTADE